MENNILSIYREKLVFDYDVSGLQDKIDEILVLTKLMGYITYSFWRPSRSDFFIYYLNGEQTKGFFLSFVNDGGVVERVGRGVGDDIYGNYYEESRMDEFLDELDKILVYI